MRWSARFESGFPARSWKHSSHAGIPLMVLLVTVACALSLHAANESGVKITIPDSETVPARFEHSVLFKPSDGWTDEFRSKIAPMIMEEVPAGSPESANPESHFGRLVFSKRGVRFDSDQPTVYFKQQSVLLNGTNYDQGIFLWFYPMPRPKPGGGKLLAQGVRITLDAAGHPAIWEVLATSSGLHQIYVSKSLEAAAAAEWGEPLPGRTSAVEQSRKDAPDLSVARVIADGPMTMGPVVYVKSHSKEVSTVLCRCMPPEIKNLLDTRTYQLITLDAAQERAISKLLKSATSLAFTLEPEGVPNRLERGLRLPRQMH